MRLQEQSTWKQCYTSVSLDIYSGPEGARVKVPTLFFVIIIIVIICVFCAPNFPRGYKAQIRIEPGY